MADALTIQTYESELPALNEQFRALDEIGQAGPVYTQRERREHQQAGRAPGEPPAPYATARHRPPA
ncbi:hypothetical protein ACFWWM_23855 [Streptomyces sp. NPDC058682]|uniref:hypothetical protein n=1 Tax=Streptomyces sp. NPDC058682 TaxID=3346596 RepID=UPI00365AFF46